MIIEPALRTGSVKEYYFSVKNRELAKINAERSSRGEAPVINLGIGAPDGMPPKSAIEALTAAAPKKGFHKYQSYTGIPELREGFAKWYERYYHVTLNPETEIRPLVGSKEGILLISMTFLNPGDKVLVPDPGYPTYTSASLLTGAKMVRYDLLEEKGWQPDFEALEKMDLSGVKIMWTNYPNMPTGGKATRALYQRIVDFGRAHGILIVNDNPYSFILTDEPLSIFGAEGARECCLELNSLSKAHNMSGWRIGMVAGDADLLSEILKVKTQMDSGMFRPLQEAAVAALGEGPEWYRSLNEEYRRRRVEAGKIFDLLGVKYNADSSGLFLWGKVPEGVSDPSRTPGEVISDEVLYKAGVFITPGFIFGKNGEHFIRVSLCAPVETLREAQQRIKDHICR